MIDVSYLENDRFREISCVLFDLLYTNMNKIAPSGRAYSEEYQSWYQAVSQGLEKPERKMAVFRDNGRIIGFFQYYVNKTVFMIEEIQLMQAYWNRGLLRKLYPLFETVPAGVTSIEAFAHPTNRASTAMLGYLGLAVVGEDTDFDGHTVYHFRGDFKKVVENRPCHPRRKGACSE